MTLLLLAIRPTPTPMPITVTNWPADHLALPGLLVAVVALGVALYAAIYAYEAFKAAEEDLGISKRNLRVAQRTPKLEARFEVGNQSVYGGMEGREFATLSDPCLIAQVSNSDEGERRCDAFYIEVIVPTDAFAKPRLAGMLDAGAGAAQRFYEVVTGQALFPAAPSTTVLFQLPLDYVTEPRDVTIKYRLKDDSKNYPAEGEFSTTVALPIRKKSAYVQPRDNIEQRLWSAAQNHAQYPGGGYSEYIEAFEALEGAGPLNSTQRAQRAKSYFRPCHPDPLHAKQPRRS